VLSVLPGQRDLLALTVDDGVNSDVVRLYTEFAKGTGVRLTFFVNGTYRSWSDNAPLLRPRVESGQIQLGNHTYSHPDLTTLGPARIAAQRRVFDEDLRDRRAPLPTAPLRQTQFGCVAADLGYTVTTLWSGSLADSTLITEDYIVKMAQTHFRPQNIVIGHLIICR
jgi:hypothetical protein